MPDYPSLKPVAVIKALEKAGFYKVRQKGSHLQMKKGNLLVTIPVHSKDLTIFTLKSILRQARINIDEFMELLK